jgi:hypothetical protein
MIAFILSFLLHGFLFFLLSFGFNMRSKPQQSFALEAKLMLKEKRRAPDLLPRKVVMPKKDPTPKPEKVVEAKKPLKVIKKVDYARELALLSESFAQELAADNSDAKEEEQAQEDDGTYFDQIYMLIKKSFVLPPHINGPSGHNLLAVLRLFLQADGTIASLVLEQSSGDEQFDKAIMEGTKRVHNFGAVPLTLQAALSRDGVLVEMCPFKCQQQKDS